MNHIEHFIGLLFPLFCGVVGCKIFTNRHIASCPAIVCEVGDFVCAPTDELVCIVQFFDLAVFCGERTAKDKFVLVPVPDVIALVAFNGGDLHDALCS